MKGRFPDVQFWFDADGRAYIVEVCAPGNDPAPESVGAFDVHIVADVPDNVGDYEDDEPEQVVRHVMDYLRPLLPASLPVSQWAKFSDVLLAWVCAHRHRSARDDFDAERRELQDDHCEPPLEPEDE